MLGITPVDLSILKKNKKQRNDLIQNVTTNFNEKLCAALEIDVTQTSISDDDFREILANLQRDYIQQDTIMKKIEILSFLPRNWKYFKISESFPITHYIYKKLKKFDRDIGKLSLKITT